VRLILGLLKGAIIGAGVGYGAYAGGLGGAFHWITYGVIGALVGILAGRPIWSHVMDKSSTVWTAILKGVFGYAAGVGLFALVAKAWGGIDITIADQTHNLYDWQFLLGGAIGAVWGAFVEFDDAPSKDRDKNADKGKPRSAPTA
jgi:hypothetical protein